MNQNPIRKQVLLSMVLLVIATVITVGFVYGLRTLTDNQPATTPTPQPTLEEDSKYIGTYRFGKGEAIGPSGVLMIKSLRPGVLVFQLDVSRGAPSYNSGYIKEEEITFENNVATYKKTSGWRGTCEITFEFQEDRMALTQKEEDFGCGFGHGVYADGVYVKTSSEPPEFYLE